MGDHGHGREEPPSNRVGHGGEVSGEEKWRRDGTSAPEGRLGEGRGSHTQRGNRGDPRESGGTEGSAAGVSPAHLRSREPAEVLSLILWLRRLPPASLSLSPAPTPLPRALPPELQGPPQAVLPFPRS